MKSRNDLDKKVQNRDNKSEISLEAFLFKYKRLKTAVFKRSPRLATSLAHRLRSAEICKLLRPPPVPQSLNAETGKRRRHFGVEFTSPSPTPSACETYRPASFRFLPSKRPHTAGSPSVPYPSHAEPGANPSHFPPTVAGTLFLLCDPKRQMSLRSVIMQPHLCNMSKWRRFVE